MAITAATVWECNASATANNVNGGGYDGTIAGATTDYSQATTAHLTITDLASDGAGKVSSALTPFSGDEIGNVLHITAAGTGFTVGWYQVTAIVAGLATLDRSPGLSKTGGTAYLGGAMSLNSTLDDDFAKAVVAGNTVFIKFGSYSLGETLTFTSGGFGGTPGTPVIVKGYFSTRNDNPTPAQRPTINCGVYVFGVNAYSFVYNLNFIGTGVRVLYLSGTTDFVKNVSAINSTSSANRQAIHMNGAQGSLYNVSACAYFNSAITFNSTSEVLQNVYIYNSLVGITENQSAGHYLYNVIIDSCTTPILNAAASYVPRTYDHLTIFGGITNRVGTGLSFTGDSINKYIKNSIFTGLVLGLSHGGAGQQVIDEDYNCFYNNTNNYQSGGVNTALNTNDVTTDPTFANVGQVTGTTGAFVAGGSKLVDTSKDFTTLGVVAGTDCVYIVSGTGVTAGIYLIDSISTTTNANDTLNITIPQSPGTDVTADKVYQITTGHNFAIGTNLKAKGFPGAFPGGLTTGYTDIGAVQREEAGGGGGTPWCGWW